jgi:hypothetical protein
MKLPHLPPLVFAKKILSVSEKEVRVLCEFDMTPSLAMFIEAAAQSSAAFFQDGDYKVGYLANAKNIQWINRSEDRKVIVKLNLEITFESMSNYSFTVTDLNEENNICSGEFTVSIQ